MKTLEIQTLINALTEKGIKFEYYGANSRIDFAGEHVLHMGTQHFGKIGIQIEDWIWCWWSVWDDGSFWFEQRYNMCIGKARKGFTTEIKAAKSLWKMTGINITRAGMDLSIF